MARPSTSNRPPPAPRLLRDPRAIIQAHDAPALEAWLVTARISNHAAAVYMEEATATGWPQGADLLHAAYPEAMAIHRRPTQRQAQVVDVLSGRLPATALDAALATESSPPAAGMEFFTSRFQPPGALLALCSHPGREALWQELQAHCPGAVRDMEAVMAPGQARARFFKSLIAPHNAGILSAGSMDFLATRLPWPPGIAAGLAIALAANGRAWDFGVPPEDWTSQAAWKDFLARRPDRKADFARDMRTSGHLSRLLRAVRKYRTEQDQAAWVDWLAATLPRVPSARSLREDPSSLYPRLAAAFARHRLDQSAQHLHQSTRRRA